MARVAFITFGWIGIAFMLEPLWPLGDFRWGLFAAASFSFAWLTGKKVHPTVDNALTWGVIVSWVVAGALVVGLVAIPALVNWISS